MGKIKYCLVDPRQGCWRRWWHPTPVLLPGKSHRRRSLAAVHGVTKSRTWLSDFTFTFHFHALEKEMATHSSVLAWRIPGTGEPGGLPSMGSHRVGHNWSNLAAAADPRQGCRAESSIRKGSEILQDTLKAESPWVDAVLPMILPRKQMILKKKNKVLKFQY